MTHSQLRSDPAAGQEPELDARDEGHVQDDGTPARPWTDLAARMAIPGLLVFSFALFSILAPDLFFSWTNVRLLLGAQATMLLLAVAATIPLRAGEFDLSIAAVLVGAGCLVGKLNEQGLSVVASVAIVVAGAVCVGLVNSLFIVGLGLDGLIVTLGMSAFLIGLTAALTESELVTTIPESVVTFANDKFLSLPYTVWVGWLVAAIAWFIFECTPLGRYLLFLGGNPSAARLAGLRVGRLRVGSYVAASVIACLAGILLAGSLGAIDPSTAGAYLLPPFTAAFLGTTAIYIGRFNIVGTVVGLYLLAVGITGLQLLGVSGWVTDVFNGAALVGAIAFAKVFELRRSKGRRHAPRRGRRVSEAVEAESAK